MDGRFKNTPWRPWQGKAANAAAAQEAFFHRAKLNGAARYGKYSNEMESGRG
jgi:fructose-bisphosphate aldolase class I